MFSIGKYSACPEQHSCVLAIEVVGHAYRLFMSAALWLQMDGLPEEDARWLFQQLMVALDMIHRLGIVNRDVKVAEPRMAAAALLVYLLMWLRPNVMAAKDIQAKLLLYPVHLTLMLAQHSRQHGMKSLSP